MQELSEMTKVIKLLFSSQLLWILTGAFVPVSNRIILRFECVEIVLLFFNILKVITFSYWTILRGQELTLAIAFTSVSRTRHCLLRVLVQLFYRKLLGDCAFTRNLANVA